MNKKNISTILTWAQNTLCELGYTFKTKFPEKEINTPYSYVARFKTTTDDIYLKHTPPGLALEAAITRVLRKQFNAPVVEVIADNPNLHCFLMKNSGKPLREVLSQNFNTSLYCHAIRKFTSMQRSVENQLNDFLDLGVPDWRLEKLPTLYMELLSEKDLLMTDGLSEMDITTLQSLQPTLISLCNKLSNYAIEPSIVQPDFHDNNILIADTSRNITFIDLGEIVISHPFFSLTTCLYQAKRHHALREVDDAYQELIEACLSNYLTSITKKTLREALDLAQTLWPIFGALSQYRLMLACEPNTIMSLQPGKLSSTLKVFIQAIQRRENLTT